ncbi:MAG: response regulator [Labilithrix sp.]|nr:response regulator [Labilithrix sp.]MBX3221597.1 response regulator [Labilithrix sp.]
MMGSPKVLVVDDEPLIHSAIRRVLRRDFDIVEKTSAEEAVAELGDDLASFDVVLLDVNMPGVPDGVDLFRRIEQLEPRPAVIFMTGDPHIAKVLPRTTRARCLAKPFGGAALREAIAEILEAQES